MGSLSALRGRIVLVVEDEPLIALDLAEEITAQGAHSLVANTAQQALSALAQVKFAAAIVDHLLGDEDASEVIRLLEALQTPFLIHTGYDGAEVWMGAPVVRKPAAQQHLMRAVADLLR